MEFDNEVLTLALQKVGDGYSWGGSSRVLLLREEGQLSPSDLDGDDTLDYEEVTGINDTTAALQIDKTFYHAALYPVKYTYGMARAVAHVEIADTTPNTITLDTVTFTLKKMDSDGNLTTLVTAESTPNLSNNSATYVDCDCEAWLPYADTRTEIGRDERMVLQVEVYAHVDTGSTGKMRLDFARGSHDSYLEIFMGRYL